MLETSKKQSEKLAIVLTTFVSITANLKALQYIYYIWYVIQF